MRRPTRDHQRRRRPVRLIELSAPPRALLAGEISPRRRPRARSPWRGNGAGRAAAAVAGGEHTETRLQLYARRALAERQGGGDDGAA